MPRALPSRVGDSFGLRRLAPPYFQGIKVGEEIVPQRTSSPTTVPTAHSEPWIIGSLRVRGGDEFLPQASRKVV